MKLDLLECFALFSFLTTLSMILARTCDGGRAVQGHVGPNGGSVAYPAQVRYRASHPVVVVMQVVEVMLVECT